MIPVKQLAEIVANFIVNVAVDKLHRRIQGGFEGTNIIIECGWSGEDILLKVKNIKGQVIAGSEQKNIISTMKKKIILPPGVKR